MAFNPINWLLGLFSLDIAIDLGTANTLVLVRNKGIVINEPSWVTIDKKSRLPLSIGLEAKEMVGRTPANVLVVRPVRDGVISEFDVTQVMLEYFIGKVHEQSVVPLPRPPLAKWPRRAARGDDSPGPTTGLDRDNTTMQNEPS